MDESLDTILRILSSYRLRFGTEAQLQADVAASLAANCIEFAREVPLKSGGRIDFYLPIMRIGLECKTAGGPSAVIEQLVEYAGCDAIDGLILISRKRSHCLRERAMCGKPFRSLWIGANSL